MTLEWKSFQGREHVYWSLFKVEGNAELVKKFKGTGTGYDPQVYGLFESEGYVYSAVSKVGRSGKSYFDIERVKQVLGDERPEETAHKQTLKDYPSNNGAFDQRSADIKKLHDENLVSTKELTSAILAVANELQGVKHLLQIIVNDSGLVRTTFKTASELNKKIPEEAQQ